MTKKKANKAIEQAMTQLNKRYDTKVVMKMDDESLDANTFSTGRPKLDKALGGGYGIGKMIEIFAETGCGKTGLALEAIASVQSMGGNVAIIDGEHALDREYAESIGIDIGELYICQPDYGEQGIETARVLIDTGEFDLIVIDSVASLIPKAELEGESGEVKMGLHARLMSQACKMLKGTANINECTIIFINQLRKTIAMFGPNETTTGGKALAFYADQRLEIKRKGWIKEGDDVIGFKQQIKVVKNKIGVPFKVTLDDIVYGKGLDEITSLVEACIKDGVLVKAGSWIKYNGEPIAQGMVKIRELLGGNLDLVNELKKELEDSGK